MKRAISMLLVSAMASSQENHEAELAQLAEDVAEHLKGKDSTEVVSSLINSLKHHSEQLE